MKQTLLQFKTLTPGHTDVTKLQPIKTKSHQHATMLPIPKHSLSTEDEIPICITENWILVLRNDVAGSDACFFNRSWAEYENEFGNQDTFDSKYWIGLKALQNKSQGGCTFRVELGRPDGSWRTANYENSSVGTSSSNYKLTLGPYSGDLWDALAYHNGQQFSTYDADNDVSPSNCAHDFGGGFWFKNCGVARITASPSWSFMWNSFANNTQQLTLRMVQFFLLC